MAVITEPMYKGRKPYMDYRHFDPSKDFTDEDVELWLSCGVDDKDLKPKHHIRTKKEFQVSVVISVA